MSKGVAMLRLCGVGRSETGLVRSSNEDAGFVGPYLALVADGVGGAAAGEVASATAAYAMAAHGLAHLREDPAVVIDAGAGAARAGIRRGVQEDLTRLGMATTLSALVCDGRRVVLGHVGDSRVYRQRDGLTTQVSTDHTYVQRMVDSGELAPEAVSTHPWRNVVLRSVDGDPADTGVDIVDLEAVVGDRFMLCSDGVSDLVATDQIADALTEREPAQCVDALVSLALAAGGRDNITCIVVDLIDGPFVVGDGALLGTLSDPTNIVDPAAVRLR